MAWWWSIWGLLFFPASPLTPLQTEPYGTPSHSKARQGTKNSQEMNAYPTPAYGNMLAQSVSWVFMNAETRWMSKLRVAATCVGLHMPQRTTTQGSLNYWQDALLDQISIRVLWALLSTRPQPWASMYILAESSFSTSPAEFVWRKPLPLIRWSPSRSDQRLHPLGSHGPPPSAGRLQIPRCQSWAPVLSPHATVLSLLLLF